MLVPRTAHRPARPEWDCEVCGEPWPCAIGRVELLEQYSGWPFGLSLLLGSYLIEAINDYSAGQQPRPADLYERIIGWIGETLR